MVACTLAKTDIGGCTSSDFVVTPTGGGTPFASRIFYLPDTGEICELLDCGGGRAPPKTTVPGCPLYSGTETYSPSFLPSSTSSSSAPTGTNGADGPAITGSDDGEGSNGSDGEDSKDATQSQGRSAAPSQTNAPGSGGAGVRVVGPAAVGGAVLAGLAMI